MASKTVRGYTQVRNGKETRVRSHQRVDPAATATSVPPPGLRDAAHRSTALPGIDQPRRPHEDLAAELNSLDDSAGWTSPDGVVLDGKVEVAVQVFDAPVDQAHARGLLGYYLRSTHGVDQRGFDPRDLTNGEIGEGRWRVSVDFTEAGRQRDGHDLSDLAGFLVEGSPIRTSNRSGPGTAGTRKFDGIGECLVAVRQLPGS